MAKAFDTFLIKAVLPPELEPLRTLAYNLHWAWNYETIELFRLLDRDLWRASGNNPVKMLGMIKQDKLSQALNDEGFMAQLDRANRALQDYLNGSTWLNWAELR